MALSRSTVAHWFFVAGIVAVLAALLASIVKSLARGQFGLDIIAALSMSGALYAGEALAGAVVALMYAGGQLLEDFAQGRAQREMTALLGRVARTAQVYGGNGRIDRIEHGTDVIAGKASAQLFHARHEFFQNVHQQLESERR